MTNEAEVSMSSLYISSGTICKTMSAKGTVLLMVLKDCLSSGFKELELQAEVYAVLDKFKDVIPDEIPAKLPPIKGINTGYILFPIQHCPTNKSIE